MKSQRCLAIMTIVGILLLGNEAASLAQTPPPGNCRYFPTTGHYLCGKFRRFFETRGQLEIFGYPLTEAFVDPTHGGLRVQYFQRARMEEHPDNPPPYDVLLGLLVDELGTTYPRIAPDQIPAPEDPAHHYFPETGHVVSYGFLDFFRTKGGLDIFGYPRSEMVFEDGLVVQYFQRSRMERRRGRPEGKEIVLTNVGEMYIERFGIPGDYDLRRPPPPVGEGPVTKPMPRRLRVLLPLILANATPGVARPPVSTPIPTVVPTSVPPTATPGPTLVPTPAPSPSGRVTSLDVSASVRYPITGRTGTQTTYVYVNDQEGRPVGGAEATLTVHYPDEDVTCNARPTDGAGFTRCSFDIPSPPVGKRVVVDVLVSYDGMTAATQTFFVVWW